MVRGLAAVLVLALAACAAGEAPAVRTAPQRDALLTPWMSLDGGWRADAQRLPLAVTPAGPRLRFVQPVGVAARGDVVVVADAGARTVWRLDRQRDTMSAFAPFNESAAEAGASIQLGEDFTVWMALPDQHRVVQYDARGRLVRQWRDEFDAARPVAVVVPPARDQIAVGDAATSQVVIFDPLGRAERALGRGPQAVLQGISAMAFGPGGLYVLDRFAQQVIVLDAQGRAAATAADHQLVQPRALAVDASGRVFVADEAGRAVKVFRGSRLLATVSRGQLAFGRIESLAVDGNLLYAADSLLARVHVLMIAPPSLEVAP